MAISFNQIPSNLRIPYFGAEFDNSRASQGPALLAYRNLLIVQKTATGTAAADSLHLVTNVDQIGTLAGRDSMAFFSGKIYFKNNTSTETWIGVLEDDGSGTAAQGTVEVDSAATGDGVIALYVAGKRYTVGVSEGDSATQIATAIGAALSETAPDEIFTATASGSTVEIDCNHKGVIGNEIRILDSYQRGEQLPAGVALTITQPTGGAGNPSLDGLIAAMGDQWFNVIANPYKDATNLTALEEELKSRAGALRQIDGLAIAAEAASVSNLATLGESRNSPYSAIVSQTGAAALTPSFAFSAALVAVASFNAANDPARPMQTLSISGVLPAETAFLAISERNILLFKGIATTREAAGGVVQIERLITTYKENAAGGADTSYLDATTIFTLMYLRFSFRARFLAKYPRHKLANDGTRFGEGQPIMTPLLGKAEAVSWFKEMANLGLVEGLDQFKNDIIVERNAQDPNRLDFKLSPDLMNQLIVGAAQISFLL